MQIHSRNSTVPSGELPVRLNPGSPAPFAIVEIGNSEVYLQDLADCDRLIKAAAEAKRLLSPPMPEPVTMLVLDSDDPIAVLLATGHALSWDTGTVQGNYVLKLHGPDGLVVDVGYGRMPDAALENLRGHLAEPPAVASPLPCTADHPSGAWGCTLDAGHEPPHKSVDSDGTVRKEWADAPQGCTS